MLVLYGRLGIAVEASLAIASWRRLTSCGGGSACAIRARWADSTAEYSFETKVREGCISVVVKTSRTCLGLKRACFAIATNWTGSSDNWVNWQIIIWESLGKWLRSR